MKIGGVRAFANIVVEVRPTPGPRDPRHADGRRNRAGKDHGFGRWFVRIASEKIPGTEVTYGARIESVKNAMCANFKRDWSDAQYRDFEEWRVDPIEIQKVSGSPDAALWKRIPERARTLGADISDDN